MGPVTLNKDKLINPGGVEVDVIPIMKSPCSSPKPPKKKTKRARSEMGFYKSNRLMIEDDRGSLPELKTGSGSGSLYETIIHMRPERFLGQSLHTSNESLASTQRSNEIFSRSLGSADSFPQRSIMGAVKQWLEKSSPCSSTDNIDVQSMSASLHETIDSASVLDEDDILEFSGASFPDDRSNKSFVPNIIISEDQQNNNTKPSSIKRRDQNLGKFIAPL